MAAGGVAGGEQTAADAGGSQMTAGGVADGELPAGDAGGSQMRAQEADLDWVVWEKENEQLIDEFLKNGRSSILDELPVTEPSPDVVLPLLQHQKEWLSWALKQEASQTRGGILADEMGMGKTIEAIALVLTARRQSSNIGSSSSSSSSSSLLPRTRCTLVICPPVLVTHWKGEIDKCTDKRSTRFFVYHGVGREKIKHKFDDYDFIITTYPIVRSEFSKYTSEAGKLQDVGDSPLQAPILHSVRWERIILDEAHVIKNSKCKTAQAVFALESLYKWALSGIPFQNRVGELYPLVRFLQISPFSYFYCQHCNCKVLECRYTILCSLCPHYTLNHLCWWHKNIVMASSDSYGGRRAMVLLKERVLKNIMLRRTKEGRAATHAIPPKTVYLKRNSVDKTENEIYEALKNRRPVKFGKYAAAETVMGSYVHIVHPYSQLPQVLDHPYLIPCPKAVGTPNGSEDGAANQNSVVKGFEPWMRNRIGTEVFQTSTKIDALKEEIRNMLEYDGTAKGVVFSQFTQFLELIHHSLKDSGIKCVKLIGSIPLAERVKATKSFTEDRDYKIILMSLKAGGVALNLTVASHVFMMEPWWNSVVELQAHNQIHRIGQYKPVRVFRFIIEGTIEEKILRQQQGGELVFSWILGDSTEIMIEKFNGLQFKSLL